MAHLKEKVSNIVSDIDLYIFCWNQLVPLILLNKPLYYTKYQGKPLIDIKDDKIILFSEKCGLFGLDGMINDLLVQKQIKKYDFLMLISHILTNRNFFFRINWLYSHRLFYRRQIELPSNLIEFHETINNITPKDNFLKVIKDLSISIERTFFRTPTNLKGYIDQKIHNIFLGNYKKSMGYLITITEDNFTELVKYKLYKKMNDYYKNFIMQVIPNQKHRRYVIGSSSVFSCNKV